MGQHLLSHMASFERPAGGGTLQALQANCRRGFLNLIPSVPLIQLPSQEKSGLWILVWSCPSFSDLSRLPKHRTKQWDFLLFTLLPNFPKNNGSAESRAWRG